MMTLQRVTQIDESHDDESKKKSSENNFHLLYEVRSSLMAETYHKVYQEEF